jgi:hypothetical protein
LDQQCHRLPLWQETDTQVDVFKHVIIEGCGYQLREEELTAWLKLYCILVSIIEEEVIEDEEGRNSYGSRRYVVKMKKELATRTDTHVRSEDQNVLQWD